MKIEKSCGAVVFSKDSGAVQYVLIRQIAGFYGFPKGHMEGNETEIETALREIQEEVGLRPTILEGFRICDEYPLPQKPDTLKQVIYYLAEYTDQTPVYQPEELTEVLVVDYDRAMELLTYDSAKAILTQANEYIQKLP